MGWPLICVGCAAAGKATRAKQAKERAIKLKRIANGMTDILTKMGMSAISGRCSRGV
jgi:hypothetical protein